MARIEAAIDAHKAKQGAEIFTKAVDKIIKSAEKMEGATTKGAKKSGEQAKKSSPLFLALRGSVKKFILAYAGFQTIKQLVAATNAYQEMGNKLKVVTASTDAATRAYQDLHKISQRTRSAIVANVNLYSRLALNTRKLGLSSSDLLTITENLNKAIIVGGSNAQESSNALIQLSQGLASGTLRGDELRSVLEQLPVVADLLASSLGVSRGELRAMGRAGLISSEEITKAFLDVDDSLNERFLKTSVTISQQWTRFGNDVKRLGGSLAFAIDPVMGGIVKTLRLMVNGLRGFIDEAKRGFRELHGLIQSATGWGDIPGLNFSQRADLGATGLSMYAKKQGLPDNLSTQYSRWVSREARSRGRDPALQVQPTVTVEDFAAEDPIKPGQGGSPYEWNDVKQRVVVSAAKFEWTAKQERRHLDHLIRVQSKDFSRLVNEAVSEAKDRGIDPNLFLRAVELRPKSQDKDRTAVHPSLDPAWSQQDQMMWLQAQRVQSTQMPWQEIKDIWPSAQQPGAAPEGAAGPGWMVDEAKLEKVIEVHAKQKAFEEEMSSFHGGARKGFRDMNEELTEFNMGMEFGIGTANEFATTLADISTGAVSAGEAFKALGRAVIHEFNRMIAQALIFRALSTMFPSSAPKKDLATGGQFDITGSASPQGGGGFEQYTVLRLNALKTEHEGGVNRGPLSGYPVMLHGTETVIPGDITKSPLGNKSLGGSTTINNISINAIDAKTFDDYFKASAGSQSEALGRIVSSEIQRDPDMREAVMS